MAFQFRELLADGAWVPVVHVVRIFLGYHLLMLLVSLVGWGMQTSWHRYGLTGLYPLALTIGLFILFLAAWQMYLVLGLAAPVF